MLKTFTVLENFRKSRLMNIHVVTKATTYSKKQSYITYIAYFMYTHPFLIVAPCTN